MNDNNELYYMELLDKFLSGKIEAKEEVILKEAAAKDSLLEEKLKEHIAARANIRIAGEQQLKKRLEASYDQIIDTKPPKEIKTPKKIALWKWASIAATVSGLFFALYLFQPSSTTSFNLADHLNNPPVLTVRGNQSTNFTEVWNLGATAYEQKNYKKAIIQFNLLNNFPTETKAHEGKIKIFKSLSYLQLKDYKKAIEILSTIAPSNPLFDQANWYLGLAYLEADDQANASKIFEKIINTPNHFKKAQAQEFLNSLK